MTLVEGDNELSRRWEAPNPAVGLEDVLRTSARCDVTLRSRAQPVIATVLEQNRTTVSELRGGAFCASFEGLPDGEPWVQVKSGVLNVFYPSDEEPLAHLRRRIPSLPTDAVCAAWEPWKYATLECPTTDAAAVAVLVEELFLHLYDFPADTSVASEILDMRDGR